MAEEQKIGNLNGKWSILFRAFLTAMVVIIPISVPWTVWVTRSIFEMHGFIGKGDRFSLKDGAAMEQRLTDRIHTLEMRQTENLRFYLRKDEHEHEHKP